MRFPCLEWSKVPADGELRAWNRISTYSLHAMVKSHSRRFFRSQYDTLEGRLSSYQLLVRICQDLEEK